MVECAKLWLGGCDESHFQSYPAYNFEQLFRHKRRTRQALMLVAAPCRDSEVPRTLLLVDISPKALSSTTMHG